MTNPTPDAALPCPFCGQTDASVIRSPGNERLVFCHCCEAAGPLSLRDPVKLWNRRAGQSHDAGLLAALEAVRRQIAQQRGGALYPNDADGFEMALDDIDEVARAAIAAAKGA